MAEAHLLQRRRLLNLARHVSFGHEANLKKADSDYKKQKDKILYKLFLTTLAQNRRKQRRLTQRLETLSKVILILGIEVIM